jgi:hypothetical protein
LYVDTNYSDTKDKFVYRQSIATYTCRNTKEIGNQYYFDLSIKIFFYTQTLVRIDLSGNNIGDKGIECLTDALQNHQVIVYSFSFSPIRLFMIIDIKRTVS